MFLLQKSRVLCEITDLFNFCVLRSGTGENYNELTQLLEDISSYLKDMQSTKEANKKLHLKESDDRIKGLQMREAAMETYKS